MNWRSDTVERQGAASPRAGHAVTRQAVEKRAGGGALSRFPSPLPYCLIMPIVQIPEDRPKPQFHPEPHHPPTTALIITSHRGNRRNVADISVLSERSKSPY